MLKKYVLVLIGAAIGIGASIGLRHLQSSRSASPADHRLFADGAAKRNRDDEERRKIAWRIIAPRLEIAQEEAIRSAENRVQQVREFFTERQKRVPEFAERTLSMRSKWELTRSKLPGADKAAHTRFLKEEFSRLVFSEAELGSAVTGAVEDYVRDIHAIENALLVKVRADLSDMPGTSEALPELRAESLFRERFDAVLAEATRETGTDATLGIGRLVGSEIAAAIAIRVGSSVATRLGISAGIMGTSAVLGPETLGISIAAGLIVDQIAGWVIGWFYDPEVEIANKLHAELGTLTTLIVSGDAQTRGLKQELAALAERRKVVREAALREMILIARQ